MNMQATASPRPQGEVTASTALGGLVGLYRPLLPALLGLTFARCGLISTNYGSYVRTDEGVITDGTMFFTVALMGLLMIALSVSNVRFYNRHAILIMKVAILAEALLNVAIIVIGLLGWGDGMLRFVMGVLLSFCASVAIFCWLRFAKGSACATAVVLVFGALAVSEVILYVFSLLPSLGNLVGATVVSVLQLPLLRRMRSVPRLREFEQRKGPRGYFGVTSGLVQDKRYLVATAIGIGLMAVLIGLLRGYPDGAPVPFTAPTRLGYGLLTVAASLAFIAGVLNGSSKTMPRNLWVAMQLLACIALLAYAVFPDNLEVGAVFTTTLNALMVGYNWYVIIAFESCGWRDSFYYCFGAWIVFLGLRSVARLALIFSSQLTTSTLVSHAVMGTLLVVSVQAVFLLMTNAAMSGAPQAAPQEGSEPVVEDENAAAARAATVPARVDDVRLSRIMGLDNHNAAAAATGTDERLSSMRRSAEEVGRQFMLSERETEVLALYALGHTQKRVAAELFITKDTVHAHVKHIYEKTGMHSRQEILDYMEEYCS